MDIPQPIENLTDFTEFEWFLPTPRKLEPAITIPNDKCFNLNKSLCSQMPKWITVGISQNGKEIRLKEKPEVGFRTPKSGTIKSTALIAAIKKRGIRLPARYLVEPKEDCWVATLIAPTVSASITTKTPKKPRRNGLEVMLPKRGNS